MRISQGYKVDIHGDRVGTYGIHIPIYSHGEYWGAIESPKEYDCNDPNREFYWVVKWRLL